jgi:hypothetical protein
VFTRVYSNSKATMDCNTWTGSVTVAGEVVSYADPRYSLSARGVGQGSSS